MAEHAQRRPAGPSRWRVGGACSTGCDAPPPAPPSPALVCLLHRCASIRGASQQHLPGMPTAARRLLAHAARPAAHLCGWAAHSFRVKQQVLRAGVLPSNISPHSGASRRRERCTWQRHLAAGCTAAGRLRVLRGLCRNHQGICSAPPQPARAPSPAAGVRDRAEGHLPAAGGAGRGGEGSPAEQQYLHAGPGMLYGLQPGLVTFQQTADLMARGQGSTIGQNRRNSWNWGGLPLRSAGGRSCKCRCKIRSAERAARVHATGRRSQQGAAGLPSCAAGRISGRISLQLRLPNKAPLHFTPRRCQRPRAGVKACGSTDNNASCALPNGRETALRCCASKHRGQQYSGG